MAHTGSRPYTYRISSGPYKTSSLCCGPKRTNSLNTGPYRTNSLNTGPQKTSYLNTGSYKTSYLNTGSYKTSSLCYGPKRTSSLNTRPYWTSSVTILSHLLSCYGTNWLALVEGRYEGRNEGTKKNNNNNNNIATKNNTTTRVILGKFVAEIDEIFSSRRQRVSEKRDGVADVQVDGGHIGTGVTHRVQILPWDLVGTNNSMSACIVVTNESAVTTNK